MRFVLCLAALAVGVALALAFGLFPLWLLLPAATIPGAALSRRWRSVLREVCFLSSALNVLAFAYIVPLLPTAALFILAGLLAPRDREDGRAWTTGSAA